MMESIDIEFAHKHNKQIQKGLLAEKSHLEDIHIVLSACL